MFYGSYFEVHLIFKYGKMTSMITFNLTSKEKWFLNLFLLHYIGVTGFCLFNSDTY